MDDDDQSPTHARGTRGRWKSEREPGSLVNSEGTRASDRQSRPERDVKSFVRDRTATNYDDRYQPKSFRGDTRETIQSAPERRAAALSQQRREDDGFTTNGKEAASVANDMQKPADPLFVPRSDRFFSHDDRMNERIPRRRSFGVAFTGRTSDRLGSNNRETAGDAPRDSAEDRWKHDRWDGTAAAQDGDGNRGEQKHAHGSSGRARVRSFVHAPDSSISNNDRGYTRKDISFRSQRVEERPERREGINRGEKRRQGAYNGVYGEWSTKQGDTGRSPSGGRWGGGEMDAGDRAGWRREERTQPARTFLRSKDDDRWQHDMFSEVVRSPSPPAESAEEKIKKIEALLAS